MNLLDTALEWFAVGYPVIGAGQAKKPYRKGWNRFFREKQTEAEARDEFKNGAWGIGGILYPGSDYLHLDFEGKCARAAWKQTGIALPETARNITQSGGEHLVFKASALLRESEIRVKRKVRLVEVACGCVDKNNKKKNCGVDLLVNGFAILPGSPNYREDPDCPFESAVRDSRSNHLAGSRQARGRKEIRRQDGRRKRSHRSRPAQSDFV